MKRFALAVTLCAFAQSCFAAVLTFEGAFNTIYDAPIVRSGFVVGNPVGEEQHFHEITSTQFSLPNNGTGILLNDRDSSIFVERDGGGTFTFNAVDYAQSTGNSPGDNLVITGLLLGVQQFQTTLGMLTTYQIANGGASAIDRLVFDGTGAGGGFVLDNLTLDKSSGPAVPEPGTMGLLSAGIAAVILRRRKK